MSTCRTERLGGTPFCLLRKEKLDISFMDPKVSILSREGALRFGYAHDLHSKPSSDMMTMALARHSLKPTLPLRCVRFYFYAQCNI